MSPYRVVFGKPRHLLMEIEHWAYWVVKSCNFSLDQAREERKLQLNELDGIRLEAYQNYMFFKERWCCRQVAPEWGLALGILNFNYVWIKIVI